MRRITASLLGLLLLCAAPYSRGAAAASRSPELAALDSLSADSATPVIARREGGDGTPFFVLARVPLAKFTSATGAADRGRDFLRKYGAVFGIKDAARELAVRSVTPDALGMTHVRYDQKHKGLPVFGRQLVVHLDRGAVTAVNGEFTDVSAVATDAEIAPEGAADAAFALLAKRAPRRPATAPVLLVYVDENDRGRLAWEVRIATSRPLGSWRVFVDALDGRVLFSYDDLKTAKNRNTYTNGNNPFCGDFGAPLCTLPGTLARTETGPVSGNATLNAAHDNAGIVYDYFQATFGRDSYDGAGHTIRSTAHFGDQYVNAFWCDDACAAAYGSSPDGEQMAYGDGDGTESGPLALALDIVAHELTHAVTDATAGLQYFGQSGALNESYSDVFAVMVDTGDWQLGEDVWTPGTPGDALRDMQDPTLYNQPAHMTTLRYSLTDNAGVHFNSGIPNKAAYLTVADPGYGVGRAAAQQIYYRALTTYLTPTSDFIANLNALVQAATDLYGAASPQVAAITRAQAAVGLANPPAVTYPAGGESLPQGVPFTVTWTTGGVTGLGFQVDALRDSGPVTFVEGFEASASLPAGFSGAGNQPWVVDTFLPDSGIRSAASGVILDRQRSRLAFTKRLTAAGNVTFRAKVSSEQGYDFFSFWVDGVPKLSGSGEIPWGTASVPVGAGTHSFVWMYEKDSEVAAGSDRAWIDQVTLPSAENVSVTSINAATAAGATSQSWTPSTVAANYRIRLLMPGLAPWLGWTQSNALFSVAAGTGADLSITKTDSPDPVTTTAPLTYTLAVTNLGPSPASSVSVSDPLPPGTSYVSATGTDWTCGHSAGTVTCTRPSLAVGVAPAITLVVNAPASTGSINNTAFVSSATSDAVSTNNSSMATTTVVPPPVASSFYTVAPCRAADTRDPDGPFGGPALSSGVDRTFTIGGRCGVPVTARAVAYNVTLTGSLSGGHVTLFPGGSALPASSTLNFSGQTRANNAVIPLGSGGTLAGRAAVSAGTVHLILDVNGYFE